VLSISLQPRSDGVTLKDTFVNIRDTNEFVVNIASIGQADAVHRSAFEFDSGVDEFAALRLEKAPSEVIAAPRIADAPISFECVVNRIIPMPPLPDHVVWGDVKRIHVRDDLYLDRGRIDVGALGAFGRLAGEYTLVNNIFSTPLPDGLADELAAQRAERLDGHATDYSPVDTAEWSPSGATK
jgi:flavin reductase (DIM6/NTAB) family NADH-FMN oxidoreductase RutF